MKTSNLLRVYCFSCVYLLCVSGGVLVVRGRRPPHPPLYAGPRHSLRGSPRNGLIQCTPRTCVVLVCGWLAGWGRGLSHMSRLPHPPTFKLYIGPYPLTLHANALFVMDFYGLLFL